MSKSTSISIRIDVDELEKLKVAAKLEAYSSYSEFIRRTALLEATRILNENNDKNSSTFKWQRSRIWVKVCVAKLLI